MFSGIKSVIYPSSNLDKDTKFWESITGVKPYFEESYYVGFSIDDCELGLDPNAAKEGLDYPIAYWRVKNTKAATEKILAAGATVNKEVKDVGGGMLMVTFKDPNGNVFGIIDNPNA